MLQGFEGMKTKTSKIISAIDEYTLLVNKKDENVKLPVLGGYAPGLGMETDSDVYRKMSSDIRQGIFKVIAMGEFKNGKSTLLNSMIGGKVLPAKSIATTAIITILIYGKFTNRVIVYTKGKKEPVEMSAVDFNEKYRLTPQDEDIIQKQGYLDRFADVEYAVIECDYPLCQNGVRLIDSPGLGEAKSRTATTLKFIPSANAVIFLLNATKLFSQEERKYIKENFAKKKLRNVFFVVNRINQISDDDIDDVKESVRYNLQEVFADDAGKFDESLYNRRVFYVNAFGALEGKQKGEPSMLGSSGVPELEKELESFLTTEDRVVATFQSSLSAMANTYVRAEDVIAKDKAAFKAPLAILEKGYAQSVKELNDLDTEIKGIEKAFATTKTIMIAKIYQSLNDYVNEMESRWEADSNTLEAKIGIKEMLKLAGVSVINVFNPEKRKEKLEEIIKPIGDEVGRYIERNLEQWANGLDNLIEPEINNLKAELNERIEAIDLKLENAMKVFTGSLDGSGVYEGKGINGLQFAISLIQGDVSILVENAAGGGFAWGEYFKRYIIQAVLQVIIFSLLGGPLGIVAFIGMEIFHMLKGAGQMNERILFGLKSKLFTQLKESISSNRSDFEEKITYELMSQSNKITDGIKAQIKEIKGRQMKIIEDKRKAQFDGENAAKRLDRILARMYELLDSVYYEVYNKPLTKADISNIASQGASK